MVPEWTTLVKDWLARHIVARDIPTAQAARAWEEGQSLAREEPLRHELAEGRCGARSGGGGTAKPALGLMAQC